MTPLVFHLQAKNSNVIAPTKFWVLVKQIAKVKSKIHYSIVLRITRGAPTIITTRGVRKVVSYNPLTRLSDFC